MRSPLFSASAAHADLWNDRLSLLLQSTGEGIFGIDTDGRCVFANRAAGQLLGREPEQMLHRNMHYLIHHTRPDGAFYPVEQCPIFHAFLRGEPCRIDTEVLWRADGSSFPAEYSSFPIEAAETGQGPSRILGAVVTFKDITERKRTESLLRRSHEDLERRVDERTKDLSGALNQMRELSAHLASIREDERTRIAREIHDELGSLLVALKMDVNWLGKRLVDAPTLQCKCHSMGRLIDRAVDNVGRIITDLRPSILDHQGLWAALEWHAQEFADGSELEIDCRIDVPMAHPAPPQDVSIAVFRIFQEMLSNVARHAQARRVRIRVEMRGKRLLIEVDDDGQGAMPGAFERPNAYGIQGMRERAGHFGGSLELLSQPGCGTLVRLLMPMPALSGAVSLAGSLS